MDVETTDIFRGAFLLASGGELAEVRVRNNGRRIATFLIAGKNLDELDRDYRSGRVLVNPLQLRKSLNHLRDVMFEKLRQYEGRTRYDRKETIESIKAGVDLASVVRAKGIGLKKNGTLQEVLPEDPEVIKALKKIGILNGKGHEIFYNCVVFPLYSNRGSIVNLYGRNIEDDNGVSHLYLPGSRSGLVNRQAVKRSQSILLTESIIDALTLYDQGFKNVVPIYGVNGLIDDHLSFFNRKVKETYLVFDTDDAGRKATEAVLQRGIVI